MYPLLFGAIGPMQIVVILVIVLLLFGGKKIPELMRGVGRGVREFKDAVEKPLPADDEPGEEAETPAAKPKRTRKATAQKAAGSKPRSKKSGE